MKPNIERQKEKVEKLLQLIKENPGVEILPMVDYEIVPADEYALWWMAKWGEARLDKYWIGKERIYSYSQNLCLLAEDWVDDNYEDYKGLTDKELFDLAEEKIKELDWTPAIIVRIEAY